MVAAWNWGQGQMGRRGLMRTEFQFSQMKKAVGVGGGDGRVPAGMYWKPMDCTPKSC